MGWEGKDRVEGERGLRELSGRRTGGVTQVGIEIELTKYPQGVYSSVDKAGQSMSGISKRRR
jgi:hypothetical protein